MNRYSNWKVTGGMDRAFRKGRSKGVCDNCGMPIPIYPGRYPRSCPNCGTPLFQVKEAAQKVLQDILNGERAIRSALCELAGDPDTTTLMGKSFDRAMQKVTISGMMDQFMGFDMVPAQRTIKLYFSEHAKKESVENLAKALCSVSIKAMVQESDDPGAKWMVISSDVQSQQPPFVKGNVDMGVPIHGEVSVSGDEKPSEEKKEVGK